MKTSDSEFIDVRGLRYHMRMWGPADAPRLFFLHGWMDVSATFQFLIDAFKREWRVIAPDWRGFGLSAWRGDAYWFPDYLGDLDAILDRYAAEEPVRLIGHSMGGNVACLYAGVCPERVARVVSLEGFGLMATKPEQAPARYRKWLEQLRAPVSFKPYASREELAMRLQRDNPRLSADKAAFLAQHFGREAEGGRVEIAGDPWHRLVYPVLYRLDEYKACWREVQAPVLWLAASESFVTKQFAAHREEYEARLACFRDIRDGVIQDAGHNLHHDQPERVAAAIEDFLSS